MKSHSLLICISLAVLCGNICFASFRTRTKRVRDHSPFVKRTKRIGTSDDEGSLLEDRLDESKIDLLKQLKSDSSAKLVKELIEKLIERIEEKQSSGKTVSTATTTTAATASTINGTTFIPKRLLKNMFTTDSASHVKNRSNRSLSSTSPVITSTRDKKDSSRNREPVSVVPELIKHPPEELVKSPASPASNDIHTFRTSLYGFCRAQKLRQTFTAKGCENVTIETIVCGGVCQDALKTFYDTGDVEKAFETCKYCGPLEYEEKLIFMQCYKGVEKRRRWELTVRKMYVPKTCGCIKESCHKLNKVTAEGVQRLSEQLLK